MRLTAALIVSSLITPSFTAEVRFPIREASSVPLSSPDSDTGIRRMSTPAFIASMHD